MADYGPATYGDRIAGIYDSFIAPAVKTRTDAAVDFLASIAGTGRALELGIGTGRVAIPLAERGVAVEGIDASAAMIERLHSKPGGADIRVALGDFASVGVAGRFELIYCVLNTFFALLEQEQQVRCFRAVADHLTDQGAFVIEAFVPDPTLFDRGQRVGATRIELERVELDATRHDALAQRLTAQHILISSEGIVLIPVELRYAWPSELDLMAQLAGMRLRQRFGGWRSEPFTTSSPSHVSVFERERA